MSLTIEEVMSLVDAHARAVHDRDDFQCVLTRGKLRTAVLGLVAQARDEEAEECEEICVAQGVEWDSDAVVTNKNYADHCAFLIRARIAGRKDGGART